MIGFVVVVDDVVVVCCCFSSQFLYRLGGEFEGGRRWGGSVIICRRVLTLSLDSCAERNSALSVA